MFLNLTHDPLNKLLKLQLFDGKPTTAGPITKTHSSSIILDNNLQFPVDLLVTQLSDTTLIVLELLWLCNINSEINWKDLTMKFPRPGACLATVHVCLQPTNDPSEAGATSALTALLNNSGDTPLP
ncbi:hypothetical protein C0993_007676 [Termitomyces sp. T159_Od127]|nr:hypothetical protein C0993_007676 [Termitomyces sp. T159_Od127]